MEARKKQILERYGYLKREINMSYLGNPRMEQLKLEMANVIFDMELNDLTHQDYIEFRNKRNKLAHKKSLIEKVKTRKKTLKKGVFLLILGLLLILFGIGLTELTNGGIIFYGLIFFGISLIILGGLEIYAFKILK